MHIGIFYNQEQVGDEVVSRIGQILRGRGARCDFFCAQEQIVPCDRLLVLGGDGTILHAAKRAAEWKIPLVGVNFGRLGFLTEFERGEVGEAVELLLSEECDTVERTMLEADLNGTKHVCLNELALLRGISPERAIRVETISVTLGGRSARDFLADGLIVATPTGSTAYSLSAGGSILMPDCNVFILTPVCSCSMRARPIVCSDRSVLDFSVEEGDTLMAYGDGEFLGAIRRTDKLTVRRSGKRVRFLTRDPQGFFLRLTQKIN